MSVKEIVDTEIKMRVMKMRVEAARQAADFSAQCFLKQLDRANRLEADLVRARRQNAELLQRMGAMQPERKTLLLPWQ